MKIKAGIKLKLIGFIVVLLVFVMSFSAFLVLRGVQKYQEKSIETLLLNQKDMFEQYFYEKSYDYNDTSKDIILGRGSIFNRPWLRNIPANIYDINGVLLSGFKNDDVTVKNDNKDMMISYAINGKISYQRIDDVVCFYSPLKCNDETIAILELQYSITDNILFYKNIKMLFIITGALAVFFGTVLGILYVSKLTKDIYIMKNAVDNIKQGAFNSIDKLTREDELGELSKGIIDMSKTIQNSIHDLEFERDCLNKAVDKLKSVDKEQKQFISNVTHEFKTPLTTIRAYSDLINLYRDDMKLLTEGTSSISDECDRLSRLVDKVLKLSALEKYDFEIKKDVVDLTSLLKDVTTKMQGRIKKNDLNFKLNINENIVLTADDELLRHCVINLIDNAIKYNVPNGSIEINAYIRENYACIECSDTGIGISEENLPKIFEPFFRAESHRSSNNGSAGLGLPLVKKLVEKQDGTIEVYSKLNEGTKFYIKLPLK